MIRVQVGAPPESGAEPLTEAQLAFLVAALREVGSPARREGQSIIWVPDPETDRQVWRAFRLLDRVERASDVGCFDCWIKGRGGWECDHPDESVPG